MLDHPRLRSRTQVPAFHFALLVVLVAVPGRAAVGQQFSEDAKRHLPVSAGLASGSAVGDVDGDGDPDLVVGGDGTPSLRLFLNDGYGRFTDGTQGRIPSRHDGMEAVRLGDLDGDGDLDIVCGNGFVASGRQNFLFLNDGKGRFSDATANLPSLADETRDVALGDVDGDRDLDLVFANIGQDIVCLNDGKAKFANATITHMPVDSSATEAVALVDVDNDRDLDLVLAMPNQNLIYRNDGRGRFANAPGRLPPGSGGTEAVVAGDVDRDGDFDLVFGAIGVSNQLLFNDGKGSFKAMLGALPKGSDASVAMTLGDLDGDGDLDLIAGNMPLLPLLVAQNRIYSNDGRGRLTDVTSSWCPKDDDWTSGVLAVDVEGDGDVDVICANNVGYPSRVYVNDGSGRLTNAGFERLPPAPHGAELAVAAGDFDGDSDADLVVAHGGHQAELHLNGGNAWFTAGRLPSGTGITTAVVALDIDRDGDRDLVLGNRGNRYSNVILYLNDGKGGFADHTKGRVPPASDRTMAIAHGDIDGDGDPDLIIGNANTRNRLYLNSGNAVFSDATSGRLPADTDGTRALSLGDVDRDGDLDLVVGNWGQQNRLYLNNGKGTFTDATKAHLPADTDLSAAVTLGDVDGDGDLDLVVANGGVSAGQTRLFLNNGAGTFSDVTTIRLPIQDHMAQGVAASDLDGDGDPDLVLAESMFRSLVYLNRDRQLTAPYLAALGLPYALIVDARPGYAPAGQFAIGFVNLTPASQRLSIPPFGRFGLSLAGLVVLPPLAILAPAGRATIGFTIPQVAGLAGNTMYAQALVVRGTQVAGWRLTNVTSDRIVR